MAKLYLNTCDLLALLYGMIINALSLPCVSSGDAATQGRAGEV